MLFLLLFSVLISSNVFALSSEHAIVIDKGEVITVSPDSIYGTVIGNVAIDSTILFYYLKNPCYPDKKVGREKDIYLCRSSVTGRIYRIYKDGSIVFQEQLYWPQYGSSPYQ